MTAAQILVVDDNRELAENVCELLEALEDRQLACVHANDAKAEPGGVAIFVRDDGPGIPEQVRPHVFRALFTTRSQGTGLGLALATRIVEAHSGELTLEKAQQGTAFRLWLPSPQQD